MTTQAPRTFPAAGSFFLPPGAEATKRKSDFWPLSLRTVAMAMAALTLAWGITVSAGLVAAMTGAALGTIVGQKLGRSRLRLPVVLGGVALLLVLLWGSAALAVGGAAIPKMLGPSKALVYASVARFFALAFCVTAGFRAAAVRRPAAIAVELAFVVVSITSLFASHRDGVIARPLWLSDWAWRAGFDPAQILLGVGVAAVGILAVLLLLETRSGRGVSSLIVLVILAVVAVMFVNVAAIKPPDPLNDLGLKNSPPGEPPKPTPPDPSGHGQNQNDGGGPDGKEDGGEQGGGLDGGEDGGGTPDGGDGGEQGGGLDGGEDGGGQPDAGDAGEQGGGQDAGEDGGQPDGGDAGEQQPSNPQNQDGGGGSGGPPPPSSQQNLDKDSDSPSQSQMPVAIVLLDNEYSPPSQGYYFREEALSQFNGSRLVTTSRSDADRDILRAFPVEKTPVPDAPKADGRKKVFTKVVLVAEHTHPFGLETPALMEPAPNPNPSRFNRAYRVESLAQQIDYKKLFGKTAGNKELSEDLAAYYLHRPTDPRYKTLADTIVAPLPPHRKKDPFAQAVAIKLYMDKEFIYSTKHKHANVPDPTADFLFGDKTGYCVHFAHAAVYMWRSLGIPARVGVGYMVPEDQRKGGSTIMVRGGDAHAWPELYIEGLGWIVLDIAAERNLDKPRPQADDDLQRLLGEMAREQPPDPKESPKQKKPAGKGRNWGKDLGIAGLWFIGALLAAAYLYKMWRRLAPVFASGRAMPRVGYRAMLDVLAEAGHQREFGETREAFAARIGDLCPTFSKLTDMHSAARLRNPTLDPTGRPELDKSRWKEALRATRRELRKGGRGFRRFLGILNPVSFLDSK